MQKTNSYQNEVKKALRGMRAAAFVIAAIQVPLMLSACAQAQVKSEPMTSPPGGPLELGEIWNMKTQAQADEIVSTVESLLLSRYKAGDFIRRDAHPKHHGCAKADVDINANQLPLELQVGLLSPDARKSHQAWIRFSNGSPDGAKSPDLDGDIRGMAIKLMNVERADAGGMDVGSLDLVMLTSKEFISEDAEDYLSLHRALNPSWGPKWLRLTGHFLTHWTDLRLVMKGQSKTGNPLQPEYFSSVPYKLGPRSMKFKARACPGKEIKDGVPERLKNSDGSETEESRNFLKARLADILKKGDACYELFVQPNMEPDHNPVERANAAWDETKSPYYKVATINIKRDDNVSTPERMHFCENLSFDPWRTFPETRPMGQINRIRLMAYPKITNLRHNTNQMPQVEPKSFDVCSPGYLQCEGPLDKRVKTLK